jgi:hypothetical protein
MKQHLDEINKYRVREGYYASEDNLVCGMFRIPKWNKIYRIIVSDEEGWEHVSVSIENKMRCPTWEEMCWVKSLFWEREEVVMQLHPAESENISVHDYCLHLWRPTNQMMPLPDPKFVR